MTVRALVGLLALNASVAGFGSLVLWAIRGYRTWSDALRLLGLGYLLGLAALFIALTLILVLGIPLEPVTVLVSVLGMVGLALALGRHLGREVPRGRIRVARPSLLTGMIVAAMALYFEAFFRSGRLRGPGMDWDAWRAWTLRAKSIYFDGGLDPTLPSVGQTGSYPPGLSAFQAVVFHAMGSADAVTLHLVTWFPALAFVAALVGLLGPRVPSAILLPFALLLLMVPYGILEWGSWLMADLPMGFFLATATVLIALALDDRRAWRLVASSVLLGGAMLTKREGQLFAAVIVVAAMAGSWRERRSTWPRLALVGGAAFALAVPWRIWFAASGLPSDGPESGYLGFVDDIDRGLASFELVVSTFLAFDFWLAAPALSIVACTLALFAGERRLPAFVLGCFVLSIAASTWVIWTNPTFEISRDYALNPVGRLGGTVVLLTGSLTPLLLARAWSVSSLELPLARSIAPPGHRQAVAAWLLVVVAALGYPMSMVAGVSAFRLPGGAPPFPSPDDCVVPVQGEVARVVLAYSDSYEEALELRSRALRAGLGPPALQQDGCGRLRLSVGGAMPLRDAERLVELALRAGFEAAAEGVTH